MSITIQHITDSKCPSCDGEGLIYKVQNFPSGDFITARGFKETCKPCQGKGYLPFKFRMPTEVPDGMDIVKEKGIYFFREAKGNTHLYEIPTPYQVNQIVDVTCDACGGRGVTMNCLYCSAEKGICYANVVCPYKCTECNGIGKAQAKVLSITEVTNEYIKYEAIREG